LGENLHIRIFDENRARIVDKPEAELLQGEPLISFNKKIPVQYDLEKIDADVTVRQDADRIGQEVSKLTLPDGPNWLFEIKLDNQVADLTQTEKSLSTSLTQQCNLNI
jgi:hypothetical protein